MGGFLGAALRSFSGRILGALSALIAAYSVTRHLSVADSGLFFLSLGFALFFSHFLRIGLDNFVLKKCSIFLNDSNNRGFISILVVSVLASLAGSALIFIILNVLGQFIHYQYTDYLLLVFPAAVAIALVGIIAHAFHASGFVFTGAVTNTSAHFLIFSCLVWLTRPSEAPKVVILFIIACFLSLVIQIIVSIFLFKKNGIKQSDWKAMQLKTVDYKEIVDTTLPLWLVVLAQQLNQWGSQFISSVHVSESDLALLAIATRIALLVPMVLTAVNMVVSPKFAAHSDRGEIEKTEKVLKQSLRLLLVVSSVVFLTMILFGDDVLRVFGPQYVQAATLLSILVFGQLINALTGPSGKLLMMSGFEKDVRNSSLIVTVLGLMLALFLVANYGVIGAAISTAVTIATQNLAFAFLVDRRLNINLLKIYSKIHKP